ncbi:unnamed protein product, partial [Rotaria sp. Silwood1]
PERSLHQVRSKRSTGLARLLAQLAELKQREEAQELALRAPSTTPPTTTRPSTQPPPPPPPVKREELELVLGRLFEQAEQQLQRKRERQELELELETL